MNSPSALRIASAATGVRTLSLRTPHQRFARAGGENGVQPFERPVRAERV